MTEYVEGKDLNSEKVIEGIIAIYNGGKAMYHNYDIETEALGAAQPLTNETVAHLFRFINKEDFESKYQFKNIIPANVLKFSTDEISVAWHTKARKQKLLFKNDVVKSGEYPIPRLLWVLKGKSLSIYALAKEPTSERTRIYMAPFMNVNFKGGVCMGSAKFTTTSNYYDDIIVRVEEAFFNSYFTHTQHNNLIKGNYVEFLEQNENKIKFPIKILEECNFKNLRDVIR